MGKPREDFGTIADETANYGGGDGDFAPRIAFPAPPKGKTSETEVRVLKRSVAECYEKWVDGVDGNSHRVVVDVEDMEDEQGKVRPNLENPLLYGWKKLGKDQLRPTKRFFMNALIGEWKVLKDAEGEYEDIVFDPEVKLFVVGIKIMEQVAGFDKDKRYPNVDETELSIVRKGSGIQDTSYTVRMNPEKTDMPEYAGELHDLEAETVATSYEKLAEWLGIDLTPAEPAKEKAEAPAEKSRRGRSKTETPAEGKAEAPAEGKAEATPSRRRRKAEPVSTAEVEELEKLEDTTE